MRSTSSLPIKPRKSKQIQFRDRGSMRTGKLENGVKKQQKTMRITYVGKAVDYAAHRLSAAFAPPTPRALVVSNMTQKYF